MFYLHLLQGCSISHKRATILFSVWSFRNCGTCKIIFVQNYMSDNQSINERVPHMTIWIFWLHLIMATDELQIGSTNLRASLAHWSFSSRNLNWLDIFAFPWFNFLISKLKISIKLRQATRVAIKYAIALVALAMRFVFSLNSIRSWYATWSLKIVAYKNLSQLVHSLTRSPLDCILSPTLRWTVIFCQILATQFRSFLLHY